MILLSGHARAMNNSLRAGQLDWIFFNRPGRKFSFAPDECITI